MLPEKKHIHKVIEGCADRGVEVSEELASIFYKSFSINPHVNTNLQKQTKESNSKIPVVKIVNQCVNRLSVHKDPAILCVKMQLILEQDYKDIEFIINKVNEDKDLRIKPLLNEILDVNNCEEISVLNNQRIIQYIILINNMGDPTSPVCIQETSSALNTIINHKKLSDFEQLSSLNKKKLNEIANLVCGLRLYNVNQSACKEEILDILDTLPKAINLLLQNINQDLEDSLKKKKILTSWIQRYYKVDNDLLAPLYAVRIRFATIRSDELNEYKTVLVFYLQYMKNLEMIKQDLTKIKTELPELLNNFNKIFKEIKHHFKNTNDFDEVLVFPELIDVSAIWNKMTEIMNYLSFTANLILKMKQMLHKVININGNQPVEDSFTTFVLPINEKEQQNIIETYPLHPMCEWNPPSSNIINKKSLFADGYCVVTIVETEGTLLKHNINIGTIQYADKWFGFASIHAAVHFGTKPSYYLNCFYNLLRSQTHLLFFFHLYEQISEEQYLSNKSVYKKYNIVEYKDAQVQTVSNPCITIYTVPGYFHNTPEKRRCSHFSIPKMTTRSAQTMDVYKSVDTQTAECDVGCNTMREKGTNTNEFMSHLF